MAEMGYELALAADRAVVQAALGVPSVFNVMAYGAVADSDGTQGNGTDNTAAFQAAIAAASVVGGTIWVPPGTFRIASADLPITASDVHFDGVGKLFFDTANTSEYGGVFFDGGETTGYIENVSCKNITVFGREGVRANALPPAYEGYRGEASLITFRGCKRFKCEKVEAYQSANYAVSVLRSSRGTVWVNDLHDCTADGVHVQDGCSQVTVALNDINECGDDMVGVGYWGAANEDIAVIANKGKGCGACGIAIYAPIDGCTVAWNQIRSTFNSGIKVIAARGNPLDPIAGYMKGLAINDNTIVDAGMRDLALFSRGQGPAMGVHIDPFGGTITDIDVSRNKLRNVRNQFIAVERPSGGVVEIINIKDNTCDGIGGYGVTQTATATGSTGQKALPQDTTYAGINVPSATLAAVSGNTVRGAVGAAIVNNATTAITKDNLVPPAAVFLAADNFDRADVAPAPGALGSTPAGNKTWVGDGAGITGNRAYFAAGAYAKTYVDVAQSNMGVSVDVTLNGAHARVFACSDGTTTGQSVGFSTNGDLFYYNGSSSYVIPTAGALATAGTFTIFLAVVGDFVVVYVDGALWGSGTIAGLPANTFAGFGEDAGTTAPSRFNNFSVSATS